MSASLAAQQTPPPEPAPESTPASRAAAAADKFSLDIPADAATPPAEAPTVSTLEPTPDTTVTTPTAPPPADRTFSLDTPIADLVADPRAKAVLDKDLPGLSTDDNLDKFKDKSLRQFAPLTGGQLTQVLLTQTAVDLAAITAGTAPVTPPAGRKRPIGR